jgi:hypothetical protein
MDPLSDVLRAVKLNGACFYLVGAAAPWSVSPRAARQLVPRILPDTQHLISYHILTSETCRAGVEQAAVSRAFKRETGLSPALWRRERSGGGVKEATA